MSRSSSPNAGSPFWLVSIHRHLVENVHQHWGFIVQDKDDALDKENPPRRGEYGVVYLSERLMEGHNLRGGRQRVPLQVRTTVSSTNATARISEVLGTSERPRWIPSGLIALNQFLLHAKATSELLKNPPRFTSTPPSAAAPTSRMRSGSVPSRSVTPGASGTASQAAAPLRVEILSIHKSASTQRSGPIYWGVFNRSFPVGESGTVTRSCVVRIDNRLMHNFGLVQGVQHPRTPLRLEQPDPAMKDVAVREVLNGQQPPQGMTWNGTALPQYALHFLDSGRALKDFRATHPLKSPRASPKMAAAATAQLQAASTRSSPALSQAALARPNGHAGGSFFNIWGVKGLPPALRNTSNKHIVAKVIAIEGTFVKYRWKNGAHCRAQIDPGQSISPLTFCIIDRRYETKTHVVCSLGRDPFVRGSIWQVQSQADDSYEVWFNIVYPTPHQGFLHQNKAVLNRKQVEAWKDPATGARRPPQRDDKIECDSIRLYGFQEVVWDVRGGQPASAPGSRSPRVLAVPAKRDPSHSPHRSPAQPIKRVQTD